MGWAQGRDGADAARKGRAAYLCGGPDPARRGALDRAHARHLLPWGAVLAVELLNEIVDLACGGEPGLMPWQVVSGVHDIINTMILPTLLLVLCRRAPHLLNWRRDRTGSA